VVCEHAKSRRSSGSTSRSGAPSLGAPLKDPGGWRDPSLNEACLEALRELHTRAAELGFTDPKHFLFVWHGCNKKLDPSRPMSSWRTAWRLLREAAGLTHVRFHDGTLHSRDWPRKEAFNGSTHAARCSSPTRNPRVRMPARHAGSSPLRVTPSGTDVSNLSWRARFDRRRRSSRRLDPSCRACASPSVRINSRQALARHAASVGRAT
jgi:hypothetical protein